MQRQPYQKVNDWRVTAIGGVTGPAAPPPENVFQRPCQRLPDSMAKYAEHEKIRLVGGFERRFDAPVDRAIVAVSITSN
jgi:hypothetical protein